MNDGRARMQSRALQRWDTKRRAELDEIEGAHHAIGGRGRGRRVATQQVNHAYAVLLSSQFQGFCRDLHSEAADHLANAVGPVLLRVILGSALTTGRKLDRGNPNSDNIVSDFSRFGVDLRREVYTVDVRNEKRVAKIDQLAGWRNAIAHQDFSRRRVTHGRLRLETVRRWRAACHQLAQAMDFVVGNHLTPIVGWRPW